MREIGPVGCEVVGELESQVEAGGSSADWATWNLFSGTFRAPNVGAGDVRSDWTQPITALRHPCKVRILNC